MPRQYPDLEPLTQPQDTNVRPALLLKALCDVCGLPLMITLTDGPTKIAHPGGCWHPSVAIAALRIP